MARTPISWDEGALSNVSPQCCAGSWAGLPKLLQEEGLLGTYDIILSAETIYSIESQRHLLDCIKQVMLNIYCLVQSNQAM